MATEEPIPGLDKRLREYYGLPDGEDVEFLRNSYVGASMQLEYRLRELGKAFGKSVAEIVESLKEARKRLP